MKVLLIQPEVRLDDKPFDFPFWAGIFASIIDQKGGNVAILDLNALRSTLSPVGNNPISTSSL